MKSRACRYISFILSILPKHAYPHTCHNFVKCFERGAHAIGVGRIMVMNYGYTVNLKSGAIKLYPSFGDTVAVHIKSFNMVLCSFI